MQARWQQTKEVENTHSHTRTHTHTDKSSLPDRALPCVVVVVALFFHFNFTLRNHATQIVRVQTCLQHTHTHTQASGGVSLSLFLSLVVVVAVLVFAATASKHVSSSSVPAKTKQEDKELCSLSLVLVCKTCFCLRTHTYTDFALSAASLFCSLTKQSSRGCLQPAGFFCLSRALSVAAVCCCLLFSFCVCRVVLSCTLSVAAASVCCWLCAADVFTGFRFSWLCALFLQDAHVALLLLSLMSDTHVPAHMHTHTHGRRHVRGIRKYAMMEYWTNGKRAMCELKIERGR